MKVINGRYSCRSLLVCIALWGLCSLTTNSQVAAGHANVRSSSGTYVKLFSDLKSDLFPGVYRSGFTRISGKCHSKDSSIIPEMRLEPGGCSPDDACAGSYIAIVDLPLGVCSNPETGFACNVHNFTENLSGTCVDGEFNSFVECGTNNCCIDANACFNETVYLENYNCGPPWNHQWNPETCQCERYSPVVIDIAGDGFQLTSAGAGVRFDFTGIGQMQQVAWTSENADDAFIVLDRNGNGSIDNAFELFGNYTLQPSTDYPNGFLALAEYDKAENGGNHDGVIDSRDAIFASLRLWVDSNHNGVSEPNELFSLKDLGVYTIRDIKKLPDAISMATNFGLDQRSTRDLLQSGGRMIFS